jgi:hypothetical protein
VRGIFEITDAGIGIHLGRGATHDALDHLSRADGPLEISWWRRSNSCQATPWRGHKLDRAIRAAILCAEVGPLQKAA